MRDRMMRMLPDYYRKSASVGQYFDALVWELSALAALIADRTAQLWLKTATWMLPRYEKIFGITATSGTDEERRAVLLARLAARGTCTVERIKQVAAQYTAARVEVVEYYSQYWVEVVLSRLDGPPPRMEDFTKSLREILPAHLGLTVHLNIESEGSVTAGACGEMTSCIVIWPQLVTELESTGTAAMAGTFTYRSAMEIYPQEDTQHG